MVGLTNHPGMAIDIYRACKTQMSSKYDDALPSTCTMMLQNGPCTLPDCSQHGDVLTACLCISKVVNDQLVHLHVFLLYNWETVPYLFGYKTGFSPLLNDHQ